MPVLMRSCLSLRSASLDSLRISPLPLTRAHCRSITQGTSYFKDSDTVTLGSKCSTVSQDSGIASGIAPFSHSQMIYHDMRVQTSGSTTLNRSYRFGMKTPKSGRGLYLMSDGKEAEGYRASVGGCRQPYAGGRQARPPRRLEREKEGRVTIFYCDDYMKLMGTIKKVSYSAGFSTSRDPQ